MKRFVVNILLFFTIICVCLLGLAFLVPPAKTHYMYELCLKNERLDTLASPRLILVGGSNVAYGMESGLLQDSLRMNVQNMGLHAGMGLRLILSELSKRLRSEDVVVLMPEYQHFFKDAAYGNEEALPYAVMYMGVSLLDEMNLPQYQSLITGLPKASIGNIKTLLSPLTRDDVYTALAFNKYGDVVAHYGKPGKFVEPEIIEGAINYRYMEELASLMSDLKAKGIRVYIFPPVMISSAYEINKKRINELENEMKSKGIGFEISPTETLQPDSLAYDSNYHMSYPAVHANTVRLMHCLKELGIEP